MAETNSLNAALHQLRHPGTAFVEPPVTLAFPGSGRYQQVIQLLQDTDYTYARIADDLGCTIGEVRRAARDENLERAVPQNRTTYARERRQILLDRAFEAVEDQLDQLDGDALTLSRTVSALAELVKIRRLEDGEATARVEQAPEQARESLREKLSLIAERIGSPSGALSAPLATYQVLPERTPPPAEAPDTDRAAATDDKAAEPTATDDTPAS